MFRDVADAVLEAMRGFFEWLFDNPKILIVSLIVLVLGIAGLCDNSVAIAMFVAVLIGAIVFAFYLHRAGERVALFMAAGIAGFAIVALAVPVVRIFFFWAVIVLDIAADIAAYNFNN